MSYCLEPNLELPTPNLSMKQWSVDNPIRVSFCVNNPLFIIQVNVVRPRPGVCRTTVQLYCVLLIPPPYGATTTYIHVCTSICVGHLSDSTTYAVFPYHCRCVILCHVHLHVQFADVV